MGMEKVVALMHVGGWIWDASKSIGGSWGRGRGGVVGRGSIYGVLGMRQRVGGFDVNRSKGVHP